MLNIPPPPAQYKRLDFGSEAHLVLGLQRGNMYSVCCMCTRYKHPPPPPSGWKIFLRSFLEEHKNTPPLWLGFAIVNKVVEAL